MTIRLSDLRINTALVESGEWIDEIPDMPGISLFTRGEYNSQWVDLERRLLRGKMLSQHMMLIPPMLRSLSRSSSVQILNCCLHQTCLLDWRGFDEPYDSNAAQELIFDPAYRLFRDGLMWASGQVGRSRRSRGKMPINTEATVVDPDRGVAFGPSAFSVGTTIEEFKQAGSSVGAEIGAAYLKAYGRGSNADATKFPGGLRDAIYKAREKMLADGADEAQIAAWREAFMDAARLSIPNIDAMFPDFKTVDGVTHLFVPEF